MNTDPRITSVSASDARSLVRLSTARIVGFDFSTPISCKLAEQQFVDAIYRISSRCIEASLTCALVAGYENVEEMLGRSLREVLPETEGYRTIFERWHANRLAGQNFDVELKGNGDAVTILQSVVYAPIVDDRISRIWLVLRDVTQAAQAIRDLAHAERHYRSLVERPGLVMVRVRFDHHYEYITPAAEEMFGVSIDQLNGDPGLFMRMLHPDDLERYLVARRAREQRFTRAVETEYRLRLKDGSYHWFFVRQFPMLVDHGPPIHYDLIAVDIQRHREYEIELQRASRVSLIGQLSSGIAHDFNNYLTVIAAQLEHGLSVNGNGPAKESLEAAQRAVTACSQMARNLLELGREGRSTLKEISLTRLVNDVAGMISHVLPEHISLRCEVPQEELFVVADEVQMQQVLINLALNARDSISSPRSGTISVTVDRGENRKTRSSTARVVVRDTGQGMPSEILAQIFKPFFSTKKESGGSGLGLAMVKGIVDAHHGSIHVESEPGHGTTFCVTLPLKRAVPFVSPASNNIVVSNNLSHEGSVLVLEDDSAVQEVLRSWLTRAGFSSTAFHDSESLQSYLNSEGEKSVAALVIDDGLPRVRGIELLPRVRDRLPSSILVLTSGDSTLSSDPRLKSTSARFLSKPFTFDELVSVVSGS